MMRCGTVRHWWLAAGLGAVFSCAEPEEVPSSGTGGTTGEGGKTSPSKSAKGGDMAQGGADGGDAGGNDGAKSDDDAGGGSGDDPCDFSSGGASDTCAVQLVAEVAEAGLSAGDVVTDVELLIGTTFTLPSLCHDVDCFGEPTNGELHTFHIRASGDGGLELVSSPQSFGKPALDIKPLEPWGLGFYASDVVTCASVCYDWEDEYRTVFTNTQTLHLVFTGDTADTGPTGVVVGMSTHLYGGDYQEPKAVKGLPDVTPPTLHLRSRPGCSLDDDWYAAPQTTQGFLFSEPVAAESAVLLEGVDVSEHVTYLVQNDYVLGFELHGLVPTSSNFSTAVVDLADNATTATSVFGRELAPLSGDFEGDVDFLSGADFDWCSSQYDPPGSVVESSEVPPIEGARAFLLNTTEERLFFRILRTPGATQLKFEARKLDVLDGAVTVGIWPYLPAGGHVRATHEPAWEQDNEFQTTVSTIEPFAFWLPEDGDDFLVEISTTKVFVDADTHGAKLLFDSVRTE